MKNLILFSLLSLSTLGFFACGSDSSVKRAKTESSASSEKSGDIMADNSVAPNPEPKISVEKSNSDAISSEQIESEIKKQEPTKEQVNKVKESVSVTRTNVKDIEVKVEPSERPASDVKPVEPKLVVTKPVIKNQSIETKKETEKKVDKTSKEASTFAAEKPDHSIWDNLLRKHVSSNGKVNYKGLQKDIAGLKTYLKNLAENPVQDSWSRGEKMAYWINAYNAYTVKLIVDNYPVSSITKLENGKPWDKKWITLGKENYSLNNIENDILRPKYKEARIHFAVNCAAKSCPPLLNRAWTSQNLESNFEKQTKAFVNNPAYNKISEKEIEVSKIFEWYAADFGDVVSYINKYATTKAKSNAKVKFMEYNWELNE